MQRVLFALLVMQRMNSTPFHFLKNCCIIVGVSSAVSCSNVIVQPADILPYKGDHMNYGQYETERRLKSLSSKTGKYTSRLVLIFSRHFYPCSFSGSCRSGCGFGMIKGIIDNVPLLWILMNIQPDRFATTVFDAEGNLYRNPCHQRFQP